MFCSAGDAETAGAKSGVPSLSNSAIPGGVDLYRVGRRGMGRSGRRTGVPAGDSGERYRTGLKKIQMGCMCGVEKMHKKVMKRVVDG
jgi:hypothetical protein